MNKSIAEQLQAIKNANLDESGVPEYRFTFGRYDGRMLSDVLALDSKYVIWLYHNNVRLPKKVINYIEQEII